jgi:hypothetical protein
MTYLGFMGDKKDSSHVPWIPIDPNYIQNRFHHKGRIPVTFEPKGKTYREQPQEIVYQLFAHGRWFSPASSTTKTGFHDIAKILLKVVLNIIKQSIIFVLMRFAESDTI